MKWAGYTRPVLISLMLMPALTVLVASPRGPGISPDSAAYAAAARSFAATGALTTYDGTPLTVFPPGLPTLLGTLARTGLDVTIVAVILNVALAAIVVMLTYQLARESITSLPWSLAITAVVATSASVAQVFMMLWSEPLFTVLALSALVVLLRGIRLSQVTWAQFIGVAVLVSAACLVRFAGVALLPVVALGTAVAAWPSGRRRALAFTAGATLASAAGIMVATARNGSLDVAPIGDRVTGGMPWVDVLRDGVSAAGWAALPVTSQPVLAVAGAVALALATWGVARALHSRDWPVLVVAAWVGSAGLMLVANELMTRIDPIDARLTMPALAPSVILVCAGLRDLLRRLPRPATVVAAVLACGCVVVNAWAAVSFASEAARWGVGYNSTLALESPTARAVADLPAGGVAATDPSWITWVSGRLPVQGIPRVDHYSPPAVAQADLLRLLGAVADGRVQYLVFLDASASALTPDQMAQALAERDSRMRLEPLGAYADGRILAVTRDGP